MADQVAKMLVSGPRDAAASYVPNPGLVLGAWAGPPLLLIAGTMAVIGVFLAVVGRWAVQVGISPVIPAVIAGGAVGNAVDRAQFGVVRDFLSTPWLVINLSDVAVVAGIAALGVAVAFRVRHLRATSRTITLDVRTLRAAVVPVGAG